MKTDIRAAVGAKFVEACRVLLPGLAAFALIGAGARAETVDEIIVQNIQARGGLEKLKAIRTLRTTVKRSEEHTSELQSRGHLVCRLLLEKKKKIKKHKT